MLVCYKFDNFCSFSQDVEFTMFGPGGKVMKRYQDNYVDFNNGYCPYKTAVIVGENAGGKSNFINSLKFLKSLFVNNEGVKSIRSYVNSNILIQENNPNQSFEITFIMNDTIYTYKLVINFDGIVYEALSKYEHRKSKENVLFAVAKLDNGCYVAETKKVLPEIITVLNNSNNGYGLFINKIALLGNEDARHAAEWIIDKLNPEALVYGSENDIRKQDSNIKILKDQRYLDIFRMVDYSICGLEIDEENPYTKTLVYRKDCDDNKFSREIQFDSTGVKEFLYWAIAIFKVVYQDKIVFADEMDRVLNPVLSDRVVSFIVGSEHRGQFVFSTHNVLHLDLKNYMKEQIYFITKNRETLASELYSLADFPEVRYETTKIYEFYMRGILGGTAIE